MSGATYFQEVSKKEIGLAILLAAKLNLLPRPLLFNGCVAIDFEGQTIQDLADLSGLTDLEEVENVIRCSPSRVSKELGEISREIYLSEQSLERTRPLFIEQEALHPLFRGMNNAKIQ